MSDSLAVFQIFSLSNKGCRTFIFFSLRDGYTDGPQIFSEIINSAGIWVIRDHFNSSVETRVMETSALESTRLTYFQKLMTPLILDLVWLHIFSFIIKYFFYFLHLLHSQLRARPFVFLLEHLTSTSSPIDSIAR